MITVFRDAKHERFVTQSGTGKHTKIHDTLDEALHEVASMFLPTQAEESDEPSIRISGVPTEEIPAWLKNDPRVVVNEGANLK